MRNLKKFLIPLGFLVVLLIFLWLGYKDLSTIQETNADYTFWENVIANFEATFWVKCLVGLLVGASGLTTVLSVFKRHI